MESSLPIDGYLVHAHGPRTMSAVLLPWHYLDSLTETMNVSVEEVATLFLLFESC